MIMDASVLNSISGTTAGQGTIVPYPASLYIQSNSAHIQFKGPNYRFNPYLDKQIVQNIKLQLDQLYNNMSDIDYEVMNANNKFAEYEDLIDKLTLENDDLKLQIELLQDEKQMLIDQINDKEAEEKEGS